MGGRAIPYSEEELVFIKARKSMPRRELHTKFIKKFDRTDVSLSAFKNLCKRKGWMTGRNGCFAKGHTPLNKGKTMPYNANSARTQFKKGQPPHNTHFAGHEHVTKDGYIEISIDETNPHTGFERRYVLKHRMQWEKLNGPIPDGMALKCLDGDKTNTEPQNWKLIPRAMLLTLNKRDFDNSPSEVKPAIMSVAELKYNIAKRQKPQTDK